MDRVKGVLYQLGSFLLPIAILVIAAWANGLYPLGPEFFIIADLRTQYVDFFAWYRDVLTGHADPFYTTTQALGGSTAAMFGYYLASPFNLLLPAFDEKDISVFCFLIVLLKAGCIQLSMQFFLRRRFRLNRIWTSALALGFTLSLWTVTQLRNPMWLDGLIFLPLCAWGVCALLREGRWRMLALAYGACVLTCWYMGYMVGLFLCLYMLFEGYVLERESVPLSKKAHVQKLLLFCGAMALGLAVSAIVFLPSVLAMMGSGTSEGGHGGFSVSYGAITERLPFLAGFSMEQILAAAAVMAVAAAAILFFIFRKRSLRTRAAIVLFCALMVCLIGCLAMPTFQHGSALDVMEALAYGKWVDSKTPQLFASFLTLACAVAFFCMKRVPVALKLATGLFLFLLLLSSWLYPLQYIWGGLRIPAGYHSRSAFLFVFMLTWTAGFSLRTILSDEGARSKVATLAANTGIAVLALTLTAAGVLTRTCTTWYWFYDGYPQSYMDEYMESAVEQVAELEARDPGIYRVEKAYWRFNECALNEGMSLGIDQLSSYTSTGDQNVLSFLSALGFGDEHFLTYDLYASLAGESLLGVKYRSASTPPAGYLDAGLTPVELPEGARFYENPYALPLAYGASSEILSFEMPEDGDGDVLDRWSCIEAFASALLGREAHLYPEVPEEPTYDDPEPALDQEAFQRMIDELSSHGFTFDEFGGSRISGSIEAAEDQVLLMTIPNQDGWSVTVNGEQVTPQDVAGGALMAIPVSAGENHVEMSFTTPGLAAGAALSAAALAFICCAPALRRSLRKLRAPSRPA